MHDGIDLIWLDWSTAAVGLRTWRILDRLLNLVVVAISLCNLCLMKEIKMMLIIVCDCVCICDTW